MCLGVFKSDCMSFNWVVSSMVFSLARTSFCFKEGLFLNAITEGSGKIELRVLSFWIDFQCFLIICFSLVASSQNCVTKINFFFRSLGICLNMNCRL